LGTDRKGGRSPRPGAFGLKRLGDDAFELVHPRCVADRELDYQEGIEFWRAGDVEGARDALRFALRGCGDNLWVHVALGRIALEEFHDPTLARGHFGYAFEIVQRALPRGFAGRLPRDRPPNAPIFEAAEGLAACYAALGQAGEASQVRAQAARWGAAGDSCDAAS
jgi:hypothetical protein